MAKNALYGFYTDLAGNTDVTLDAAWQRRIADYAHQNRKQHLLALLLRRGDVTAELVDELADHNTAAVKAAWLANHADGIDTVIAAIRAEDRRQVLAAVVAEPGLPDEAFAHIVEHAGGVELVVATLLTGRVDDDRAYELLESVASARALASKANAAKLRQIAGHHPKAFNRILAATSDVVVATTALEELDGIEDPDREAAGVARSLQTALDAFEVATEMNYRDVGRVSSLLDAAIASDLDRDALYGIVEWGCSEMLRLGARISPTGQPMQHPNSFGVTHFENLTTADKFDEIAEALVSGDDDTAAAVLNRAAALSAQLKAQNNGRRLPRSGYGRLAVKIALDGAYSDTVRERALADGLVEEYHIDRPIRAALERGAVTISYGMAATLHKRIRNRDLGIILGACANRDAVLDRLLAEEMSAGLLTQAADLGLLDARRLDVAAEHVPAAWFAELPSEHPAVAMTVQRCIDIAGAELAPAGPVTEFFEACYGTVSENPAAVAKIASTSN